jgi:hypothetical protein
VVLEPWARGGQKEEDREKDSQSWWLSFKKKEQGGGTSKATGQSGVSISPFAMLNHHHAGYS